MGAANPFRKYISWLLVEDEEEYEEMEPTPESQQSPHTSKRARGPLTLSTGGEGGLEIRHPRSLEDRMAIGMDLKQRRTVALDLTKLPDADARYFLEFVYGVVFALDATAEKISDGIYLLAPRGISVRNDVEGDAASTTSTFVPQTRTTSRSSRAANDGQEELFWQGQ